MGVVGLQWGAIMGRGAKKVENHCSDAIKTVFTTNGPLDLADEAKLCCGHLRLWIIIASVSFVKN